MSVVLFEQNDAVDGGKAPHCVNIFPAESLATAQNTRERELRRCEREALPYDANSHDGVGRDIILPNRGYRAHITASCRIRTMAMASPLQLRNATSENIVSGTKTENELARFPIPLRKSLLRFVSLSNTALLYHASKLFEYPLKNMSSTLCG